MTCEHTHPAPSDCKQSETWRGEKEEEVTGLKVERGGDVAKGSYSKRGLNPYGESLFPLIFHTHLIFNPWS